MLEMKRRPEAELQCLLRVRRTQYFWFKSCFSLAVFIKYIKIINLEPNKLKGLRSRAHKFEIMALIEITREKKVFYGIGNQERKQADFKDVRQLLLHDSSNKCIFMLMFWLEI